MFRNIASVASVSLLILSNPIWSHADEAPQVEPHPNRPAALVALAQDEPDLVITPHTIRIERLASPEVGHWINLPGYSELGSPCISRDGEWVAFDAFKQGYNNSPSECWIARRDGRGLTRVAFGGTPRWSPDGRRLLFKRNRENDPEREPGIFVINRDGTGEQRVGDGRWPDWSPDGTEIVFSLGGEPTGGARVGATVWIVKADGTGRRGITEGDCPSWSPDGKRIAFCFRSPEAGPVIRVHDLKTGQEKTLGLGWYRANWAPDGKSVVANGAIGWERAMVRILADSPRGQIELTTRYESPLSPSLSWDGKDIIYIARRPKGG